MLPKIVDAIGDRTEILFDGGIRSGQDVLKAIALGARGTFIGRAFLYGLRALEIIRNELDITMALCGKRTISEVNREILLR